MIYLSPIDELIENLIDENAFSITVYDMNTRGLFFKKYSHQYRIIIENNGESKEVITKWYNVSRHFFITYMDDMGLEIAGKNKEGKVTRSKCPPGYGSFIGNEYFGCWLESKTGTHWEWRQDHELLGTLLNTNDYPVMKSHWDDFIETYYGTNKTYFGPQTSKGKYFFGTDSDLNTKTRSGSIWFSNKSNENFKESLEISHPQTMKVFNSGRWLSNRF